ncbi:MAG TPA: OsmC family protein [Acidobacteriaceae bacterium]
MIARSEWTNADANPSGFTAYSESGHALRFDTSPEHREGPSPMECVLMALCACTQVDVVGILIKKRQPIASVAVSAQAERQTEHPRYFNKIRLTYTVRGVEGAPLSRKAVEDAVTLSKDKYCSVSAMLEKAAHIDFDIDFAGIEPLP